MIDTVLRFYVTALCFPELSCQGFPDSAKLVLEFLAGPYTIPTALALALFAYWLAMAVGADRAANQRTVLRGVLAALLAWGLATLGGLAWQGVGGLRTGDGIACWHGLPSACPAAAIGFAVGATLWRRDWRWGLGIFLATGLWTGAQVCCGLRYPLDVVAGTVLGAGLAWLLGPADWLDRPVDAFIRLARRLMLA